MFNILNSNNRSFYKLYRIIIFNHVRFVNSTLKFLNKINPPFEKVLIANRGEVACRIIRTCRAMGIRTVAIYSTADCHSLHVKISDESICVGTSPATKSYLDIESILEAALITKSVAVHPGYGFLSENHKFAEVLENNGIVFIGPKSNVIKRMGDKVESKRLAQGALVNTIPGYVGIVSDELHACNIANEIGYPVMIKASAGGGGKGMRIAMDDEQLGQNFLLAKNEARNSFGDDRLLIEKYIYNSRHIEVQILADKSGKTLSLNERECSIQRRNQKIIEEAPSIVVDSELRKLISSQAISLAKAVNYESAGTVEFLIDGLKNFYFLEMNTRLQVEHPITEFTSNIDIVKEMILIASGGQLSFDQAQVKLSGWAMETRIYAEDPKYFMPSSGLITQYIEPNCNLDHIRVDSGVSKGSEISIHYDHLISKLIVFENNREKAISSMLKALQEYVIRGVKTNIPILINILSNIKFSHGNIHTNFVNEEWKSGFIPESIDDQEWNYMALCASIIHIILNDRNANNTQCRSLKNPHTVFNNLQKIFVRDKSRNVIFSIKQNFPFYNILYDGSNFNLEVEWNIPEPLFILRTQNLERSYHIFVEDKGNIDISYQGVFNRFCMYNCFENLFLDLMMDKEEMKSPFLIDAPMPGNIKNLFVEPEDYVETGASLAIIEAMKMQNIISAPMSGKIKSINVCIGQNVEEGECLVEYYSN